MHYICAGWIQGTRKGIDILVNNAGVLKRGVGVFETFGAGPAGDPGNEATPARVLSQRPSFHACAPALRVPGW